MDKISWCLRQKNGIELTEPNEDLAKAYIKKAEDSLRAAFNLKDNPDWEISSSYYTMYFSLYTVLMKIGVKCEIHSCTIAFMKEFLTEHYSKEDIDLIEKAQKARIDAQYYSDRSISDELYQKIQQQRALFLAKSKDVLNQLNEKIIIKIRSKLKEYGN